MSQNRSSAVMAHDHANLWHYTPLPFALEDRRYDQFDPDRYTKPMGLWISVEGEGDWQSWCESEGFGADRLVWRAPVTIRPDANVLWLTPDLLTQFDREFGFERQWGSENQLTDRSPDWREVARRYDGIVIAPYSWDHRLSLVWYYGWDCASGCVWNLDAIEVGPSQPVAAIDEPARTAAGRL